LSEREPMPATKFCIPSDVSARQLPLESCLIRGLSVMYRSQLPGDCPREFGYSHDDSGLLPVERCGHAPIMNASAKLGDDMPRFAKLSLVSIMSSPRLLIDLWGEHSSVFRRSKCCRSPRRLISSLGGYCMPLLTAL